MASRKKPTAREIEVGRQIFRKLQKCGAFRIYPDGVYWWNPKMKCWERSPEDSAETKRT
jgi:hypothetical protein